MGEFHINTMLVVGGRWPIQPTSPHTCSQVQQDGLTRALHHKHQLLVLKACIVGLYQPPMSLFTFTTCFVGCTMALLLITLPLMVAPGWLATSATTSFASCLGT